MKRILFLIVVVAIFTACDDKNDPLNSDNNIPSNESEFIILRSITDNETFHEGHPNYRFHIAISTAKYTGGTIITDNNLLIPRVHGGQTVYHDPEDAPSFKVLSRDHSWIEVVVVCRVIVGAEEPLKFNISVGANPPSNPGIWFTAVHLNTDIHDQNMNHIRFRTNGIDILNSAGTSTLFSLSL